MQCKRMTLFAGHYGSGKTSIAVSWALALGKTGKAVTIADLDIVNPYFRTKDSELLLARAGIELICSPFANSNLDVPAMPAGAYRLVADRERWGVLDIGGDDRGALALGRYVPTLAAENEYEMLLVINRARPLTRTPEEVLAVKAEIEGACGLPFTAIVNNTNLGLETTADDVRGSLPYAEAVARATGLPLKMTCCGQHLYSQLQGQVENLFPLRLQSLYYQIKTEVPYGESDI